MASIRRLPGNLAKRQHMTSMAHDLSIRTHFSQDECFALLHIYDHLVRRGTGKLDHGRFREFLHSCFEITSDLMLDLMFHGFDKNGDGMVDTFEFVTGLSHMIRGDKEEITEFCYSIYDMNGDRSLAREELHQCLKGCLLPGYGLEPEDVDDAENEIVDLAMKKLDFNHDGQITYDDFQNAVRVDPLLVVACGDCLPSGSALARFLYTITEDYRGFTGTLLNDGHNAHLATSQLPSRFFSTTTSFLQRPHTR